MVRVKAELKKDGPVLVERGSPDLLFLILCVILIAIGTIVIMSVGSVYSEKTENGDSFAFVKEHLKHLLAGISAAVVIVLATNKPFVLRWITPFGFIATIFLLVVVLFTGLSEGEAQRWIAIPGLGLTFQPSELAKTMLIMALALYMSKHEEQMLLPVKGNLGKVLFYKFLMPICIIGPVVGLVILEHHISGAIIITAIGIAMMFFGGTEFPVLLSFGAAGGVGAWVLIQTVDYARKRVDSLINRGADALDGDWQTTQGLYAIGTGGLFGLGLGQSRLKFGYVSQLQNDFIFSIVCEELGFFGALGIMLMFLALVSRGFVLAIRCTDRFCGLVIAGLSFKFMIHTLLNIAVVTGIIPNTGISLPFFSSGGSATLIQMFDAGLILACSKFSKEGTL